MAIPELENGYRVQDTDWNEIADAVNATAPIKALTQTEYDALSSSEKNNGTVYLIQGGGIAYNGAMYSRMTTDSFDVVGYYLSAGQSMTFDYSDHFACIIWAFRAGLSSTETSNYGMWLCDQWSGVVTVNSGGYFSLSVENKVATLTNNRTSGYIGYAAIMI